MRTRMSEKTGAAIRKLRLGRGWSLAQLSQQSGVPISTLSRVELGQNALNYDKLMRLCRALDVDLEGLVAREAETAQAPSGRRSVTRAGQGRTIRLGPAAALAGAEDLLAKSLTPVIVEITAAELNGPGSFVTHAGEANLMVVDGEVAFHSHLYAPLMLRAGDAVYFDAASGYALTAPSGPARAVLVISGEIQLES